MPASQIAQRSFLFQNRVFIYGITKQNNKTHIENILTKANWQQIAHSANGKTIIARSNDALSCWNTDNHTLHIIYLKNKNDNFTDITFLPDNNSFAVLSINQQKTESKITFYEIENLKELYTMTSNKELIQLAFSPDNHDLLACSTDNRIELYKNKMAPLLESTPQIPKTITHKQQSETSCIIS